MTTAKAEATGLLIAREVTAKLPPTSLWQRLQPNPGGIQGFQPEYTDVNRDPLSTFATDEKGDHVGLAAKPVINHDLNKDLVDMFGEGWTRSLGKTASNKPTTSIYRPTAVVDGGVSNDSFTVATDGALPDGSLIMVRGCVNAANNGVFVCAGTSVVGSIKVATGLLVAETISPTGSVTVEATGIQGTAGDIQLDANGDLTSTTVDFTLYNLLDGHRIKIGDTAAGTRFSIVADAYNGWATVNGTVTAHKIPLKWRSWTPAGADVGTGKTIRLMFGRLLRNVPMTHADYVEPSWHGEKEDLGVGTANAAVYTYAKQMTLNTLSISMPVKGKIVATQTFQGADVTDPVLVASRVTGPSAAFVAIATELYDTANDLISCKVVDASNDSTLIAEVNSCTLTVDHGVSPREQLATFGAAGMIFGKIRPKAAMEIYYERSTVPTAIRNNTTCRFEAIMRNGQAGLVFDLPTVRLTGGAMSYAANSPVMVNLDLPAHRDPLTNIVMMVNVIPYVPLT